MKLTRSNPRFINYICFKENFCILYPAWKCWRFDSNRRNRLLTWSSQFSTLDLKISGLNFLSAVQILLSQIFYMDIKNLQRSGNIQFWLAPAIWCYWENQLDYRERCRTLRKYLFCYEGVKATTTTTATRTWQICIFDNEKQYFCTLCTCIFGSCSSSFHHVKRSVLHLCGRREHMMTNVQLCLLTSEA